MPFPCPLKSPLLLLRGPSPSPLRNAKSTVYVAHIHQSHADSTTVLANRFLFSFSSCFQSNNLGEAYSNISPTSIQPSSLQIPEMSGHFIFWGVRFPNPLITTIHSCLCASRRIWAQNSIVLLQVTLIILKKGIKNTKAGEDAKRCPFQHLSKSVMGKYITFHHFLRPWNFYNYKLIFFYPIIPQIVLLQRSFLFLYHHSYNPCSLPKVPVSFALQAPTEMYSASSKKYPNLSRKPLQLPKNLRTRRTHKGTPTAKHHGSICQFVRTCSVSPKTLFLCLLWSEFLKCQQKNPPKLDFSGETAPTTSPKPSMNKATVLRRTRYPIVAPLPGRKWLF